MNKMKKRALIFERVNTFLKQKEYGKAFHEMYSRPEEWNYKQLKAYYNVFETALNGRAEGNFIAACKIVEGTVEQEEKRVANVRKSPKYKLFVKQYGNFSSGYSMGEKVEVKIVTNYNDIHDTISDRRAEYRGNAKKYNHNIRYGSVLLTVDLTGARAKYRLDIVSKNLKDCFHGKY